MCGDDSPSRLGEESLTDCNEASAVTVRDSLAADFNLGLQWGESVPVLSANIHSCMLKAGTGPEEVRCRDAGLRSRLRLRIYMGRPWWRDGVSEIQGS